MITLAVEKFRNCPKSPKNWLSFKDWKLLLNVVVPSQNSLIEPTGKSQSNIGYPSSSMKYLRYIASQMAHHFKLSYMEVNKNPVHVNLKKPYSVISVWKWLKCQVRSQLAYSTLAEYDTFHPIGKTPQKSQIESLTNPQPHFFRCIKLAHELSNWDSETEMWAQLSTASWGTSGDPWVCQHGWAFHYDEIDTPPSFDE